MSFRPSHLAILAAALAPLAAGCGDDKRPVTTTISSSPATVAVVDSGTPPTGGESATAGTTPSCPRLLRGRGGGVHRRQATTRP